MGNESFKNSNVRQAFMLMLVIGLLISAVTAQPIREYPPALPSTLINGGRVQSIAVNPIDRNHIIAAHQFGGLWKTENGGRTWYHLNGLQTVFVVDVAYGPDGRTVIATVARDLKRVNGGGIWVSRDEGETWDQPSDGSGTVPSTVGGLTRTTAWGISYAPDNGRIYVATDYGVAISSTNGTSWSHRLLNAAGRGARSVQALPGNRAIAIYPGLITRTTVIRGAIFFKDADDVWRVIREGFFSDNFKNIDVSPYDSDKVFILQDYNTLLLYEVAADTWTEIPLPGGGNRWPFVRAARGTAGTQAIDLWVGLGVNLYKASCTDLACVRRLRCVRRPDLPPDPCDWQAIGGSAGLHDDPGHLGLDAEKHPVMYGSDGGLFKPLNAEATTWTLASPTGSGMNSYQITSLTGTNYDRSVSRVPSLYFGTQDNAVWGSPDGGRTWPNVVCSEGWHLQTWHQATSTSDPATRLTLGCYGTSPLIANANLQSPRIATNVPRSGPPVSGRLSESFLLSPTNWMRLVDTRHYFIDRLVGDWTLSLSTDNLEHWQTVAAIGFDPSGAVLRSGGRGATLTAYATFEGPLLDPNDNPRIGFLRMRDVLRVSPGTIPDDGLLYLPGRGNLGIRATEFDWHPIYGVDPHDPNFLIAPDVVSGTIWYSTDGGDMWTPDDQLTNLVTQAGHQMLYQGDPGQVQVTEIAFSPYERNLIMVGTRDSGVIYSEDHGATWQPVPGSEAMLYVTGFFFTTDGTVYVSTYGRGLWKIDMWWRWHQVPIVPICGFNYGDCILRLRPDPEKNVIQDFSWKEHNVLVVFGGHINGLLRSGDQIKSITVTPNSSYRFYSVDKQTLPEITESKEGAGFHEDPAGEFALKNKEIITGVIFKGGQPVGYLTNKEEFKSEQELVARNAGKQVPADKASSGLPYLSISTESPIGPGLVQAGAVIYLLARGFVAGTPADVRLDGETLAQITVEKDGRFPYTVKVDEKLSMGQHRLEVVQKTPQGERKAVATFVKVRGGDRFEQRQ